MNYLQPQLLYQLLTRTFHTTQVTYRKSGIDVDYRHFDEGAFIYYVPKTKPLKKVPAANWGVSVARLLSDTRVLDVLLNNSDRHSGHFLYGEHWADAKMCPVLIDHAAGFRRVGGANWLLLFVLCDGLLVRTGSADAFCTGSAD
jgi:hypothetical protein